MNKNIKRFLSFFLAIMLCISLFPADAFAQEETVADAEPVAEEVQQDVTEEPSSEISQEEQSGETTEPVAEEQEQPSENIPEETKENIEPEETSGEEASEEPSMAEEPKNDTEEVTPVQVTFICTQTENIADVEITVKQGENILLSDETVEAGNVYLLLPGEYFYSAKLEGFVDLNDVPFTVTSDNPFAVEINFTKENTVDDMTEDTDENVDYYSMILNGTTLSATEITAPETVDIQIDLSSAKQKIISGSLSFKNQKTEQAIHVSLSANSDNVLSGTIIIGENAAAGDYYFSSYSLSFEGGGTGGGFSTPCSEFFFTVINENEDITAPTLNSITLSASEITAPETVIVRTEITEEQSGIGYCWIDFKNQRSNQTVTAILSSASENIFTFTVSIKETAAAGDYLISSVGLLDQQGNYRHYSETNLPENCSNVKFTVINDNEDITPPELNSVKLNATEITAPGTITVTVEAADEQSGINYGLITFKNMRSRQWGSTYLSKSSDNVLTGTISIDEYDLAGDYELINVTLYDNQCNCVEFGSDSGSDIPENCAGIKFTVINENEDITAPELENITLNSNEVAAPGTITVKVKAEDAQTGINHGEIYFKSQRNNQTVSTYLYESSKGILTGTINIGENAASGEYRLSSVELSDNQGNCEYYFGDSLPVNCKEVKFTVENENEDITAPMLNSITLSAVEITAPDTITVTVEATDEQTGLSSGYIWLKNQRSNQTVGAQISKTSENSLSGTISIKETAAAGEYVISTVQLCDKQGNYIYYDSTSGNSLPENCADVAFNVINENEDITAPILKSVTFNEIEIIAPGTITVTVEAIDEQSGLNCGYIYFASQRSNQTAYAYVSKTSGNILKGTVSIDENAAGGDYKISSVCLYDIQGNSINYKNSTNSYTNCIAIPQNCADVKFTVVNENEDITAPVLNSITLSASEITAPGSITVTVEATDDKSGINYGFIWFENPSNQTVDVNLTKQSDNKWTGTINIEEYAAAGEYVISAVHFSDNQGNSIYYGDAFENNIPESCADIKFTVINENEDVTAPVLNGITLSAAEITAPGTITVTVEATDEQSGLSSGYILFYNMSPFKAVYVSLHLDSYGNLTGQINIDQFAPAGEYCLVNINLQDENGNYVQYANGSASNIKPIPENCQNLSITVINENEDVTPPVLTGITFSADEVTAPGTITVEVDASDDQSGITYGSITLENEVSLDTITGYLNAQNGRLFGSISIGEYTTAGKYRVSGLQLYDNNNNIAIYYSDYPTGTGYQQTKLSSDYCAMGFTVRNDNAGNTPPTLKNITLSKNELTAPDSLTVTVETEDLQLGIYDFAAAYFINTKTGKCYYVSLSNVSDGKLEGTVTLDEYAPAGEYTLSSLFLTNSVIYYNSNVSGIPYSCSGGAYSIGVEFPAEFNDVSFTVINANEDITGPVLNGITLSSKSLGLNEKINVTVDATDDASGISNGSLVFTDTKTGSNLTVSVYRASDNMLSGTIYLNNYQNRNIESGTYELSSVCLYDEENNKTLYGDLDEETGKALPAGCAGLSIEVINETEENDPPQLVGISLGSDKLAVPGKMKISMEATDDHNSISYAYVEFQSSGVQKSYFSLCLYPVDENTLEGTIAFKNNSSVKRLFVTGATIYDKEGKYTEYSSDPSGYEHALPDSCKNLSFVLLAEEGYNSGSLITYILNDSRAENARTNPDSYYKENITLADPVLAAYTFNGWYLDEKLTQPAKAPQITEDSEGDVTFYAKWTPISYNIRFASNGGSGSMTALTRKTDLSGELTVTNKFKCTGYTFAGWNTKADGSGKSFSNVITVYRLAPYAVNKTITLYAQWTPISYTAAFDANGGEGAMEPMTFTYGIARNLTSNSFTKEGYIFNGWKTGSKTYKDGQSVKNLTAIAGAQIVLTAQWKADTSYAGYNYKITFNGNGSTGGKMADEAMKVGTAKALTANSFTKTGYHFIGWAIKEDGDVAYANKQKVTDLNIALSQNPVTLYAVWEANTYSVTFNGNGGYIMNGTKKASTYKQEGTLIYDTSAVLDPNQFIRTGYTFKEWNTKANGSGTAYADRAELLNLTATNSGKVTLYAIWKYTVTFNPGTGEGSEFSRELTYNCAETVNAESFSKAGYYLAGWNKNEAAAKKGTVQYKTTAVKNVGPEIILYAVWKPLTYTIKFEANGGTGRMSGLAMTYGTAKALTANTFRFTGHTFLGWSLDPEASSVDFANKTKITTQITPTSNKQVITLYAVWG